MWSRRIQKNSIQWQSIRGVRWKIRRELALSRWSSRSLSRIEAIHVWKSAMSRIVSWLEQIPDSSQRQFLCLHFTWFRDVIKKHFHEAKKEVSHFMRFQSMQQCLFFLPKTLKPKHTIYQLQFIILIGIVGQFLRYNSVCLLNTFKDKLLTRFS